MTMMPGIFGNDLFDDWMDFPFGAGYAKNDARLMKTDVKEKENTYELEMDLPGYKKEDITAQLKDGYMTITAKKDSSKDEKDKEGNYIRRERYCGQCSRSFYVGEGVKEEDIKAKFENGILTLIVPKEEPKKPVEDKSYIAIEG